MKTITIQITEEEFNVILQNDSGETKKLEDMNPNEKSILFASANVLIKATFMTSAFSKNNRNVEKILKVLSAMKTDKSTLLD